MRKVIVLSCLATVFGVVLAGSFIGCPEEHYDVVDDAEEVAGEGLIDAIGPELVDAEGNTTSSDALADKDYVLLYFSAEWCPPCRQFTPELVDFYEEYAEAGNLEVVLISVDHSESEMYEYMQGYDMNWLAVPYDRREESGLDQDYSVRGVPRLVAVDIDGNIIKDSDQYGPVGVLEELVESF